MFQGYNHNCAVTFVNLFFLLICWDSSLRKGIYRFKRSSFMGDFWPTIAFLKPSCI